MGNIQTLTPFKPGQSGNPNGRPKGHTGPQVRTRLRNLLMTTIEYKNPMTGIMQKRNVAEFLAVNLIKQGLKDDKSCIAAITAIYDHAEGKLAQTVLSDPQPEQKAELETITFEQAYSLKHGQEAFEKHFGNRLPKRVRTVDK